MKLEPSTLRRFDALDSLGDDDLKMMAPALDNLRFRNGALVCREGDAGDCCYFLLGGTVVVSKMLPDGRRVRLASLGAGTLFGQSGLVPDQVRTADVKAEGEVEVATLSRRSLNWALRQKQDWAVAVQAIVAINLVRQLRQALDRLEGLAADENPEEQAEGTSRASIQAPQGLDVNFGRARRRAKLKPRDATVEPTEEYRLPPIPDDSEDEQIRTGKLLSLLAETESSMAQAGYSLDDVEFVFDDDQQRTADARPKG